MKIRTIIRNIARLFRSRRSTAMPPVPVHPIRAVVVRVDFRRGASINPERAAYPWHWAILLPSGHIHAMSASFDTLDEAARDFVGDGVLIVARAERTLAVQAGVSTQALNRKNPPRQA